MRLALLCVFKVVLLVSTGRIGDAEEGGLKEGKGSAACPVKLRPSAHCEEEEDCPYQVTLPPLTIQMPKQFKMLEKTMKELQSLRQTVNKLKSSCLECKQQADQILQRDSSEVPGPDPTSNEQDNKSQQSTSIHDMQIKLNKMSSSLKNARKEINSLQGRIEELSLLNMKNVEAMVDNKVKNLTGVVSSLDSKCSSACPVITSPQFIIAPRDCSDYNVLEEKKNGVYKVTPDPKNGTFDVYCDMESFGGGWTVIQHRFNGSVSFNRTWVEYKNGFGAVQGEFWLGNDKIHLLTKAKDMILRIELEDFEGVREYAKYDQFYVSNEYLRYRLSVSGYSGTAGDALHFSKNYNHDQKFFTTPDKDNDMYPSGNCGAYYGSGWWFDACMSANLNGKYYHKKYKGIRNGIFWGTWPTLSDEHPSSYRQVFKTVKMMIRPKKYAP